MRLVVEEEVQSNSHIDSLPNHRYCLAINFDYRVALESLWLLNRENHKSRLVRRHGQFVKLTPFLKMAADDSSFFL